VLFIAPEYRDWGTIIIILVIILISGFLHFIQEYRSSIETEKLKSMIHTTSAVKRKGMDVKEIEIEEIVPGDVVYLAAGDMIPADLRIISSKDLFVNQATLTGESEPVEKYPILKNDKVNQDNLTLTDLNNICFMGTSVVSGSAMGVVLLTGDRKSVV